jgi:sialate O-acetylesterase
MQQWDPALKNEGSGSLYGAALRRFESVGGKVAGILWYQGESDANPTDAALYKERMTTLIRSFRDDFDQPDLPFYYVQIGRLAADPDPQMIAGWNAIREAERTWTAAAPNTAMVSAIDLDLDDAIHIGTAGLHRLGKRLADVAAGFPTPALRDAVLDPKSMRIRVRFDRVRGGLSSLGRPAGFSLRSQEDREHILIYKTTLDGDSALLHLSGELPSQAQLWYGYGLNPYCNITDAEDAAIPAFGPIPIETH